MPGYMCSILIFLLMIHLCPAHGMNREEMNVRTERLQKSITLIKNGYNILPLKRLDTLRIASVNFGADTINDFQHTLSGYARVDHFALKENQSDLHLHFVLREIRSYNCVIIYNNSVAKVSSGLRSYTGNLLKLIHQLTDKRVICYHPANTPELSDYLSAPIDALIINQNDIPDGNAYTAQAIFGGVPINGKLEAPVHEKYPIGFGIETPKTRLGYALPEMCGISSHALQKIDSICEKAIAQQMTPGCQVLIAKDNFIIYNKAFGYHTYEKRKRNRPSDIYDIASVTKIAATMPAVMQLFDERRVVLDSPLSLYYPELLHTNKKEVTLKEVLAHHAGLKRFIPFFIGFMDTDSLEHKFLTTKPTKHNTLKVADKLYANPNVRFKDKTIAGSALPGYEYTPPGIYVYKHLKDTVLKQILESELALRKEYVYSDIGFLLIQKAVEHLTHEALDGYCMKHFYNKLGACHTNFLAAERLDTNHIIPSSYDKLYRKGILKGYVHDPTAFLLGGISGHAGLFSTAEDLAKIMSVYINNGIYGDERYLSDSVIDLFAHQTNRYKDNRRGLGFDKPEHNPRKISPACTDASPSSFGHSGFTGTMVWCDPEYKLIYIFLSNRTFPSEFNTELNDRNIRTKIQSVIYEAIKKTAIKKES